MYLQNLHLLALCFRLASHQILFHSPVQFLRLFWLDSLTFSAKKKKYCIQLIPRSSVRFRLKPDNSNSHGFEIHRPSNKGTKLLLKVTKAIIIIRHANADGAEPRKKGCRGGHFTLTYSTTRWFRSIVRTYTHARVQAHTQTHARACTHAWTDG